MIYNGDCLDIMRGLEADSIDAIVTDPPYGLKFMGKNWDHSVPGVPFWQEAMRVAKPGLHLLAFSGTRTFHRLVCAIEDAGWEIRDCLGWIYGSGFPKSHNLKGDNAGWGTALKPAWEPIVMARKPLEGTVKQNVRKWGTGAINIDGCRIEGEAWNRNTLWRDNIKGGNLIKGQVKREPCQPKHSHDKGRWPANLIHDGSEEVLELFPPSKSTGGDGEKSRNYKSDGRTISGSCQATGGFADSGSAARFFKSFPIDGEGAKRFIYTPKASRKEREAGLEGIEIKKGNPNLISSKTIIRGHPENGKPTPSENKPPLSVHNNHPTVKPLALMRYLCRLVTPLGGIILDPFMGSGTTGMAAKAEGFEFVGIEINSDYFKIAEKRIAMIST